jgi:hypothetical protein
MLRATDKRGRTVPVLSIRGLQGAARAAGRRLQVTKMSALVSAGVPVSVAISTLVTVVPLPSAS